MVLVLVMVIHGRLGSFSSAAFGKPSSQLVRSFIEVGAFCPRPPFSSEINGHLTLVGFGFRWRRCLGVSTGESPRPTRGVQSFTSHSLGQP
jgi:hypothetical protein